MANNYFSSYTSLPRFNLARAASVNAIFDAIIAGFDKVPDETLLRHGTLTFSVDSGAADALVVSHTTALTAYKQGTFLKVKVAATNTGASTINVDGLGAVAIKRHDLTDVKAGDLIQNSIITLSYSNAGYFILLSYPGGVLTSAQNQVTYAAEWANKAEDSLVSTAAGGDNVDDYSAKHFANKASASASAAASDAASAAADAIATAADAVSTAADAVSTAADAASAASSAATAQAAVAGIYWKEPCVVRTTGNITLSGEQTIDGVLTSADRVLVMAQTNAAENGVYVSASGAWSRATPLDSWDEFPGATVNVNQGTTHADTSWICTVDPGGTLETTDITWGSLGAVYSSATTTTEGVIELATTAEVDTGTDTSRAVVPDALAGSIFGTSIVQLLVFDDATDCATGDGAGDLWFRVPSTLNGMDLVGVAASCQTAGTTGTMDVQVHNVTQAADMLSTKITIDSAETDSSTAATPPVIDTANDDVATGDQIRIDVDAVHTTAAKGLLVELQFRLP